MKIRYNLISLLFLVLFLTPYTAETQIRVGVGGGLVSDNSLGLLQGRLEIGPRSFRLANSFNFFLDDGVDWAVDIDGQYNVADISNDVYLTFFPGINILKVSNDTDIGLNLGGALRIRTNQNEIYIEPKYTVGTYDSFAISGGFIF